MSRSLAGVLVLVLQGLSAALGKYVHVNRQASWQDARSHCKTHHTDLAPISVPHDIQRFYEVVPDENNPVWIGLMRNPENRTQWLWSGGGTVTRTFWGSGESEILQEWAGWILNRKWQDVYSTHLATFVCFDVTVVLEKKSWEGALEHCRRHHRDLASVASRVEMRLIRRQLQKSGSTEPVWTGLRVLGEEWGWVDLQPLEYQAWGAEGRPTCPDARGCGVLRQKTSVYQESQTDTSTSDSSGTSNYTQDTNVMDAVEWEWAAEDCAQENYFICY